MRILTYKRTHVGDPDNFGRFGINDCMGRVRNFRYDAVIGVGGTGYEPRSHRIDRKINWVGINPKRISHIPGYRGGIIEFEQFILLENNGPLLEILAPNLARKIYRGGRYILDAYSETEKAEAVAVIEWARHIATSSSAYPTFLAAQGSCLVRYRMPHNKSLHRSCAKCRSGR